MNCHGGDKLDACESRIYRHQGQERNTLCCPECRRSSRQRQERSRLQRTNTSVSQEYVDLQLRAQTTEANRKETTARPMPWFPRTRARQVKDLLPRSVASEMAKPLGAKLPTRSQEKQSHVVEGAAGGQDPTREGEGRKDRNLLPETVHEPQDTNQRGKNRERKERVLEQKTRAPS